MACIQRAIVRSNANEHQWRNRASPVVQDYTWRHTSVFLTNQCWQIKANNNVTINDILRKFVRIMTSCVKFKCHALININDMASAANSETIIAALYWYYLTVGADIPLIVYRSVYCSLCYVFLRPAALKSCPAYFFSDLWNIIQIYLFCIYKYMQQLTPSNVKMLTAWTNLVVNIQKAYHGSVSSMGLVLSITFWQYIGLHVLNWPIRV